MKYVSQTAAGKSISAYIIFKDGKSVGKCHVHHGNSRTFVNLWLDGLTCGVEYVNEFLPECTIYCAYGSASGYGYNKEDSALRDAVRKFIDSPWKEYEHYSKFDSRGIETLHDYGYEVIQVI